MSDYKKKMTLWKQVHQLMLSSRVQELLAKYEENINRNKAYNYDVVLQIDEWKKQKEVEWGAILDEKDEIITSQQRKITDLTTQLQLAQEDQVCVPSLTSSTYSFL